MEQKNKPQQNLIVSILITALVVGFGIYFLVNKSYIKPAINSESSPQLSTNKKDFEDYIYALTRIAEAKNIAMKDMKQTYDEIEKYGDTVRGGAVYSDTLISQYKEINVKHRLAKNKLDTIKNSEMKDSIFDLTQSLILYTEINNETIKFYQHLYTIYILEKQDNYQTGDKPSVNTAYSLLEDSFAKMDKIISENFGTYLESKDTDDYQNFKNIILAVN
jgi:uncharacterized protein with HEPN domain